MCPTLCLLSMRPSKKPKLDDQDPDSQDPEPPQQQQQDPQQDPQQQQQLDDQEDGPGTQFTDLPDPLLGVLWAKLGRRARFRLRRSCRKIRDSAAINRLIHSLKLELTEEPEAYLLRRLKAFPRTAQLLDLKLHGGNSHAMWRFLYAAQRSRRAAALLGGLHSLSLQVRGLGPCA